MLAFTLTTTRRSPGVRGAWFMGILFKTPPSTSKWPFVLTGVNTEGMETEALMASKRLPSLNTTSFFLIRSTATAAYGILNSSMVVSGIKSLILLNTLSPLTSPERLRVKSTSLNTFSLSRESIHSFKGGMASSA